MIESKKSETFGRQQRPRGGRGVVRALTPREGTLLRDHLLRLDPESRHDRFNGFVDPEFIDRYADRSIHDGSVILAYIEDGQVRAAAELHQPDLTPGSLPEIAFSVETSWRRTGLGSLLFAKLIQVAKSLRYRTLRITTGAQNEAMRALAQKFGAKLTFTHGESTGTIDLSALPSPAASPSGDMISAWAGLSRAWWKAAVAVYGPGRTT